MARADRLLGSARRIHGPVPLEYPNFFCTNLVFENLNLILNFNWENIRYFAHLWRGFPRRTYCRYVMSQQKRNCYPISISPSSFFLSFFPKVRPRENSGIQSVHVCRRLFLFRFVVTLRLSNQGGEKKMKRKEKKGLRKWNAISHKEFKVGNVRIKKEFSLF